MRRPCGCGHAVSKHRQRHGEPHAGECRDCACQGLVPAFRKNEVRTLEWQIVANGRHRLFLVLIELVDGTHISTSATVEKLHRNEHDEWAAEVPFFFDGSLEFVAALEWRGPWSAPS